MVESTRLEIRAPLTPYKGLPIGTPDGKELTVLGEVEASWHFREGCKTYYATFVVVEKQKQLKWDVYVGREMIEEIGWTIVCEDPYIISFFEAPVLEYSYQNPSSTFRTVPINAFTATNRTIVLRAVFDPKAPFNAITKTKAQATGMPIIAEADALSSEKGDTVLCHLSDVPEHVPGYRALKLQWYLPETAKSYKDVFVVYDDGMSSRDVDVVISAPSQWYSRGGWGAVACENPCIGVLSE